MKKAFLYLTFISVLILINQSCESVIEFKGKETEPKIVLYSVLQPDSLVTVTISKSHSIMDYKYEPEQITDAVVRLYRDGEFVETLAYVNPQPQSEYEDPVPYSKYVSLEVTPVQGSTYRIEVEVPGMKSVAGETSLPGTVPITGIDTSMVLDFWEDLNYWYADMVTRIRFTDPAGEENYYMVALKAKRGDYLGDFTVPFNPETRVSVGEEESHFDDSEEPLLSPDRDEDLFGMYLSNMFGAFNDELISGKQYDLTLKVSYFVPDTAYYEFLHFNVRLQSITRDLYLYLQSYSAHIQTDGNFFAEPIVVYTNVENGLGIVGAKVTSNATIEIGRYPVEGVTYYYGYE